MYILLKNYKSNSGFPLIHGENFFGGKPKKKPRPLFASSLSTFFPKERAGVTALWYNQLLWEKYLEEPT